MFEMIKNFKISLTKHFWSNIYAIIIVSIVVIVLLGVIYNHAILASQESDEFYFTFVGLVVVAPIILLTLICWPFGERTFVHVHHYFWSYACSFLCIWDTQVSIVAQVVYIRTKFVYLLPYASQSLSHRNNRLFYCL